MKTNGSGRRKQEKEERKCSGSRQSMHSKDDICQAPWKEPVTGGRMEGSIGLLDPQKRLNNSQDIYAESINYANFKQREFSWGYLHTTSEKLNIKEFFFIYNPTVATKQDIINLKRCLAKYDGKGYA